MSSEFFWTNFSRGAPEAECSPAVRSKAKHLPRDSEKEWKATGRLPTFTLLFYLLI
jgi:hypothetical protein